MDKVSIPAYFPQEPEWNTVTLLRQRVERDPDGPIVFVKDAAGQWQTKTSTHMLEDVNALAAGFIARGIKAGDRVGIMAHTSYDWTVLDYALWSIGVVSVPIYETSSADQVAWIGSDADISAVIVENDECREVVNHAKALIPHLTMMWQIDRGDLKTIAASGKPENLLEVDKRVALVKADNVATIVYTSGTTGRPKGVVLTHGNFVYEARTAGRLLVDICAPHSRSVLFLPLAHVFARSINVIQLSSYATVAYSPNTSTLLEDFQAIKPTYVLSVPRVLEKIYNASEQQAGAGIKRTIFRKAAAISIA